MGTTNDMSVLSTPSAPCSSLHLQSNAVGWLSQSVTDTFKGWQEQVVALVDSFARWVPSRRGTPLSVLIISGDAGALKREDSGICAFAAVHTALYCAGVCRRRFSGLRDVWCIRDRYG